MLKQIINWKDWKDWKGDLQFGSLTKQTLTYCPL